MGDLRGVVALASVLAMHAACVTAQHAGWASDRMGGMYDCAHAACACGMGLSVMPHNYAGMVCTWHGPACMIIIHAVPPLT